jgi:hypothetical protein
VRCGEPCHAAADDNDSPLDRSVLAFVHRVKLGAGPI